MQILGIGQHCMGVGVKEVGVPNVEQPHKCRNIFCPGYGAEVLVDGVKTAEELAEVFWTNRNCQRGANRRVDGVTPPNPVPKSQSSSRINTEIGDLIERG